ncbi:MAG: HAMP domain-containing protein [Chitinivibrionales bacterium]|nr:HAMP domain-containing protein [Chitinivibrionales bacterium]
MDLCRFCRAFSIHGSNIPANLKRRTAVTQKKAFVRKHVFINRRLQGQYMLTFLIPMLIMLIFWLGTLYFASQSIINTTVSTIKKDIDNTIAVELQDISNPKVATYRNVVDEIRYYLRGFSSNKEYRQAVLSSLLWIFGAGLLLVIIQIVLLTIFFSHRVAGPVYRFEKACHSLIEGDYTEEIRLRKNDEMKNLASLFNDAIRKTRERLLALKDTANEEKKKETLSSIQI